MSRSVPSLRCDVTSVRVALSRRSVVTSRRRASLCSRRPVVASQLPSLRRNVTSVRARRALLLQQTFVVITNRFKKKSIHRFSASRSCFLLAPWNPLRRLAITVYTNQFFDYFIITTILVNCVFLTLPGYAFTDVGE